MVGTWLLALMLAAQQAPVVSIDVDRTDLLVGDEVAVTLQAQTSGNEPATIVNPPFAGFEVLDQRDRSAVRIRDGQPVRETTRRITLRVLRAGTLTLGPAEVRQGNVSAASGTIEIRVGERGAGGALAERIRLAAERVPPPALAGDQVGLTVHALPDSTIVGAQVDVVVVAWFPRTVRERLRTPPTLRAPSVEGAWVYHRHVPAAPALARTVDGVPFDLYVMHDILFPLRPGTVDLGAATVSFALPLANSFLSREVRHEVASEWTVVRVGPLPTYAGQVSMPVAEELQWVVDLPQGELRLGEARVAAVSLTGWGNVALWPEPEIAWPKGLRVYPEETRTDLATGAARIGGTRVFRYLVVAESSGTHRVPPLRYRYFSTAARAVVTLDAPAVELVTPGARGVQRARRAWAPPLLPSSGARGPLARRLVVAFWPWGWLLVTLVPPLVAVGARVRRPRARPRPQRGPQGDAPALEGLQREFRRVLEALVPDQALREGDRLADALRAAGVEEPVAAHAARVRDRLRRAVFGPGGAPDTGELVAEVQEMLGVLFGEVHRSRAGVVTGAAALVLFALAAGPLAAQSAERLYEMGAYSAAADSFGRRVLEHPDDAAAWYDWGAAQLLQGNRVAARGAWVRAARLEPRRRVIRAGLARLGDLDRRSAGMTWIAPVTVWEALLVSGAVWVAAWVLVAARVRRAVAAIPLVMSLVAAGYAGFVHARYATPVALVAHEQVELRQAPFASAPAAVRLGENVAVRVVRARGVWRLVERADQRGWVHAADLVGL